MSKPVAVLTGDLIGSTAVSPARTEATMALLARTAADIADDTAFTRHRGDGWQMILTDPGRCLWACLYVLACLRAGPGALPSRIAVGIGLEYPSDRKDLSTATGPAFTASGRALDAMRRDEVLTLAGDWTADGWPAGKVDAFQRQCFAFAADYAARWSVQQAQAMALALSSDAPTQDQIATALGITRQAVGLRLKAAGYHILNDTCAAFLTLQPQRPDAP